MHQDEPTDRPFPSEADWLAQPLPSPAELPHEPGAFTERMLQALRDERALDRELQRLDHDVPSLLLRAHTAPAPSRGFAEATLAAIGDDRRQRWQKLLARHVAPQPSADFVARTLHALRADRDNTGRGTTDRSTTARLRAVSPMRRARTWWTLATIAAAAGLALWLAAPSPRPAPFEARLAAATPTAFTHHHHATPLAAVLAERHRAQDADGLAVASADGLWLQLAERRR